MEFKWPIKLVRPQHIEYVAEDLVKSCMKLFFVLGAWKAVELIQLATKLAKEWIG